MSAPISATQVKELREKTNCGFMECKKALTEAAGDLDKAVEILRKSGIAKAEKKADRVASQGVVLLKVAADTKSGFIVEINCETDFVASDENFTKFAADVLETGFAANVADLDALLALPIAGGETIQATREALIAKIGENIQVRRCAFVAEEAGCVGSYSHGGRAGCLLAIKGGDVELANDLAMHVVGMKPKCVAAKDLDPAEVAKEKEIYAAQVAESGKPANIVEKIVAGKIAKFENENTLLGQQFVKDQDVKVADLLKKNNAEVIQFVRFGLGEA